ncbi:hypothetical protein MUK42_18905 [Musa troglodytarum]|uniref:Uncharacterized protein n=1 Tax=Musa troglodytarum TaxID=320322 RepID=A0A9E7G531_9LILI|nr:hypothetical protein MUK42_18905 [Musa troglodytarum]
MKRADAARPAPDCTAGWSYMADASTDEKGRSTTARWMGRLSHGPSPKGPGH